MWACWYACRNSERSRKLPVADTGETGRNEKMKLWLTLRTLRSQYMAHYTLNVWSRGKQLVLFSRES